MYANSTEEFLSESEPMIMWPKNLTGLEWMERMEDEGSALSFAFETETGVGFIDLPLIMTIGWDLSALNSRPAQVRAVMHWESKIWAPETVEDRLWSSIKAGRKDNSVLLVVKLGTLSCTEYSSIMFIAAKKRII